MGQPLWLSLRPNPVPMLHLRPGTDITMVVGQDIMEDTGDTMDGAATTDTPTDTDTTVWDTVDTTDILMDTDTVTGDKGLLQIRTPHTMVITGGNLSMTIPSHLV